MATNLSDTRVAVMGAGAVGSYFGGMLARAGVRVTLIARPKHVQAVQKSGLLLDTVTFKGQVTMSASTDPANVRDAEFVLFCVKTLDTEKAARAIAPYLTKDTIVISLQNGVDNIARIRASSRIEALPAVVYVAVALPEPGHVKHSGRGEWIVGECAGATPPVTGAKGRPERVAEMCTAAGVPCRVSQNIEVDQWTKMVMNCAGNAVTAIAQTSFAHVARNLDTREVLRTVINECVAVARAAGVALPDIDWTERGLKNAETFGEATSSTAQDIARGKPTEIDSLNGYIMRRGKELGVPTPVNMTLFALTKLIEENGPKPQVNPLH